jgi:hypothetical protein
MLSSTTNLNSTNLNTSVAFRRHTNTYPFSKFVTKTNHNPSYLSSYPDLPEEEEEMVTFSSSIKGSCSENRNDDGRKKNASYRSSSRSSAILVEEAQQHQQLSIKNKRKMSMMLSEEEQEEDHLSSSEDSTSEGSLREEEDIVFFASNDDEQERQIQEPDDMMSTSSAMASLIVEEEKATMNDDPACSSSSNSNSIVRRKKQNNKKRKLNVRFDLVPAVGARPSSEKNGTMMRRMKKPFGQQKKKSTSSSSTTTTDTCRYKRIYDDDYKSTLWWTPKELKYIELSIVFALKLKEHGLFSPIIADTDILSLQRYTKQNRIQRKNIRKQMYLTVKAIKEFEIITKTKTPPELLSELLQRITTRKPTATYMEPVATIVNSNSSANANANVMGGVIWKQATTQN